MLRPRGVLALLWNRRVEGDPVNQAIEDLIGPYRADTPSHRGSPWRSAFSRTASFGPLEGRVFEHAVEQDADGLEARVGSISFIAALEQRERASVLERARALAGEGSVSIPYTTEVYVASRLP